MLIEIDSKYVIFLQVLNVDHYQMKKGVSNDLKI